MKEKTEKKDKFRRVKFMGFCMSQMPPDGFSLDFDRLYELDTFPTL